MLIARPTRLRRFAAAAQRIVGAGSIFTPSIKLNDYQHDEDFGSGGAWCRESPAATQSPTR